MDTATNCWRSRKSEIGGGNREIAAHCHLLDAQFDESYELPVSLETACKEQREIDEAHTLLSLFGAAFAPRAAAGLRARPFISGAVLIKARQCAQKMRAESWQVIASAVGTSVSQAPMAGDAIPTPLKIPRELRGVAGRHQGALQPPQPD
jgi:hypothetical protein